MIEILPLVTFRVPQPETNGLKTISGTKCLSTASFRSTGFDFE